MADQPVSGQGAPHGAATGAPAAGNGDPGTTTALADLLMRGLRGLGDAGQPDQASRLAASAWSLLRADHPRLADRLNGLLHYLNRPPRDPAGPAPVDDQPPGQHRDGREAARVA